MLDPFQPKKRRSRIGSAVAAGVGVLFGSYIPAYFLFPQQTALIVPFAITLAILILISSKARRVRRGVIVGGILGLLGGLGCFLGMTQRMLDAINAQRQAEAAATQPATAPDDGAATQPDPSDVEDTAASARPVAQPLDEPTTQPASQPTSQPTTQPGTAEKLERLLAATQSQLVTICIIPHTLMGVVVSWIFASSAVRRQKQSTSL